jgi:hypothetical protein
MATTEPPPPRELAMVLTVEEYLEPPGYRESTDRPMLKVKETIDGRPFTHVEISDRWWKSGNASISNLNDAARVLLKLQAGKWREAASQDAYSYDHYCPGYITLMHFPGKLTAGQNMTIEGRIGSKRVEFGHDYHKAGNTIFQFDDYSGGKQTKIRLTDAEVDSIQYYFVIRNTGGGYHELCVPVIGNEAAIAHIARWLLAAATAGRPSCIEPPKRCLVLRAHTQVTVQKPGKGKGCAREELRPYLVDAESEMEDGRRWPRAFYPRIALSPACITAFEARYGAGSMDWGAVSSHSHAMRTDERLLDLIVELGSEACSIEGCQWQVACLPVEAVPGLREQPYTPGCHILTTNHAEKLDFSEEHLLLALYRDIVKRRACKHTWWETRLKWDYSEVKATAEKAAEFDAMNDKFLYARRASILYI